MDNITAIGGVTSKAVRSDFVAFSTSKPGSENFLDDAMTEMVAHRQKQQDELTVAVQEMMDNPTDQSRSIKVQQLGGDLSVSKAFEGGILAKINAAIKTVVLNAQ
jgi:hypothetical protein